MVKFIPVDPSEIPNLRESRRGRVSYPILKTFLETEMIVAKLDRTGIQQSVSSLYSSLGAYAKNHHMPIKILMREGDLWLFRLDVDEKGSFIPDWTEEDNMPGEDEGSPIDASEVGKRYKQERGKTTK